jgi:hypothetical protein
MRLRLSPCVPGDLEEIAEYFAQNSPRHAARMLRLKIQTWGTRHSAFILSAMTVLLD